MTLIKKLWLAIITIMALAFGGSMVISILTARQYLEQQLQVKNIDNATALALSISQLPKDPALVELLISAQFDIGHYQFIRIIKPNGQLLAERVFKGGFDGAPIWFANLIPIHATPGQALIQDGWKQYGTLFLASHEQYAYKSLWDGAMALLVWFAWGSLAIGAAGSMALRFITRPLADVVKQAQALEARQFLHIAEPKTPELRTVVRAMNNMVDRLKAMFNEESDRLNVLRLKINNDALTGLASREYFLSLLNELLTDENSPPNGTLVILRLKDIRTLNTQLGHHQVDQMLIALAELLKIFCRENRYSRAGRLKGNEFALVCPGLDTPKQIAGELHQQLLTQWSPKWINDVHDLFHLGAVAYQRQQAIGELLSHADDALARAELVGENSWYSSDDGHAHPIYTAGKWLSLLKNAISEEKLWLDFYPVINCTSRAHMHMEAMVRLQINEEGKSLYAGDFMPMAIQLHLNTLIDIQVIQLALKKLLHSDSVIAINLSSESIANYTFRSQLMNTLEAEPQACQRMLFEVSEFGAFKQFDAFRDLSHKLKQLGCRVGIEYVSQCLGESQKLAELGLDYVKLNPVFLNGIHNNLENQSLLKGMCTLARHFGFVVIALGVTSEKDLTLLAALGFDGATGPGVK